MGLCPKCFIIASIDESWFSIELLSFFFKRITKAYFNDNQKYQSPYRFRIYLLSEEKKEVHTCTGGSESMTLAHVNGLTIQLDIILTVNTKEGVVIQS